MQGVRIRSLVWEMISHMSHSMAKIFSKRWFQVYFVSFFFSHLSALLSSVLASLSGRFSHEKQDGGHQFSYPPTGQASSVWLGSRPIFDTITEARDWPFEPCVHLWRQERVTATESQMFPKRKKVHVIPSRKGAMKTGQGKFNLSTVADDTSALDQQSDREGNSHTGFFFPEKRFFFFFLKWTKQAIIFQSVLTKQTAYSFLENICKEPNVIGLLGLIAVIGTCVFCFKVAC